MSAGNRALSEPSWTGVGVHPTPSNLVRGFARAVAATVIRRHQPGTIVEVLDACAGDGRLGHAVAKRLARLGFQPKLTLVEADPRRVSERVASYEVEQVVGDFYAFAAQRSFDVVVSNPPYLALGRVETKRLGLEWHRVVECGRNLYGLALVKCLSICRPRGVVGLLAPHGWLRNWYGAELRAQIDSIVERVDVYASSSRRLFPGVHQDVAVQIFDLRNALNEGATAAVRISYDQSIFHDLVFPARQPRRNKVTARVRVGPFVWNREKELLSARAVGLPVVYGGNISSNGQLNFNVSRYQGRQFVAKTRVPESYISNGRCLLIKRSLRGTPGDWKLDAVFVSDLSPFVAENHVIVIEFLSHSKESEVRRICSEVVRNVEREHRHHGHPNVSVAIVREALELSDEILERTEGEKCLAATND